MLRGKITMWLMLNLHIAPSFVSGLHHKNVKTWVNATVYFDIDPSMPRDMHDAVQYAVQYMNSLTCVRWSQKYPWSDDITNYVTFNYFNDTRLRPTCKADAGQRGGRQSITLGRNCWKLRNGKVPEVRRTVLHEMMHVLGFKHEHQRPDRDCYVTVSGTAPKLGFAKLPFPNDWVDEYPYDYHSVTHYVSHLGIQAINKSITVLGRHNGTLSSTDKEKVESLYCGAPSFCGVQKNVLTCRDIWAEKVNNNCSDWSGWISPH